MKSTLSSITESLGDLNIFIIIICATLIPSYSFHELGNKAKAINILMLPASSIEKWISRWLLTIPAATIVLLIVVCVGDIISSIIWCIITDHAEIAPIGFIKYIKTVKLLTSISTIAFLQSVFFLGSLLWPKLSWIKTVLMLVILAIVFGVTLIYLKFESTPIGEDGLACIGLILAPVIYIISYFRLKEAEIINRW